MERWKEIPGYPGYEVSDQGNFRSYSKSSGQGNERRKFPRSRKATIYRGYRYIRLTSRSKTMKASYFVLLAFVGQKPNGMVIRHLNDIKHDDRLANLKYGTHSENNFDAVRNGRVEGKKGENSHLSRLTEKQATKIFLCEGKHKDIADKFSVDTSVVSRIKSGKRWPHIRDRYAPTV